eukprot:gene16216-biopygen16334
MIVVSNTVLNVTMFPMTPGLQKFTIAWNSPRSFCSGVPERITRRVVGRRSTALVVLISAFFKRWPSSQMTSPTDAMSLNLFSYFLSWSYEMTRTLRWGSCWNVFKIFSPRAVLCAMEHGLTFPSPNHLTNSLHQFCTRELGATMIAFLVKGTP